MGEPVPLGFPPACTHSAAPVPAIVCDPFCGSGTTGAVAQRLGRSFVGLDLSYSYLHDQARVRIAEALADTGETHTLETAAGRVTQAALFSGNGRAR